MAEEDKPQRELPSIRDFEKRFREAFGRDMTAEERRFYRLAETIIEGKERKKDDGNAA
jgi:hypothetical protein